MCPIIFLEWLLREGQNDIFLELYPPGNILLFHLFLSNGFFLYKNVIHHLQVRSQFQEILPPSDQSGSLRIDGFQAGESYKFILFVLIAVLLG